MKTLGVIFLLIGLGCSVGGFSNGKENWEEEAARGTLEMFEDHKRVWVALASANTTDMLMIRDKKLRDSVITVFKEGKERDPLSIRAGLEKAGQDIADSEAKYLRHKAEREEKQKWYFVAGGVLIVISLILLVIPQSQTKTA